MDIIHKEYESRKSEIETELELLFKTNLKITDWDIPEPNDQESAEVLWNILNDKLQEIKKDVDAKKYSQY